VQNIGKLLWRKLVFEKQLFERTPIQSFWGYIFRELLELLLEHLHQLPNNLSVYPQYICIGVAQYYSCEYWGLGGVAAAVPQYISPNTHMKGGSHRSVENKMVEKW
jgi:hypothetical protein